MLAGIISSMLFTPAPSTPGLSNRWRLYMTAKPTAGSYMSACEVEMRATPGGPNLASGGIATASTFQATGGGVPSGGWTPAMAFDGVKTSASAWTASSATAPQWLEYAFTSPVTIEEVTLYTKHNDPGGTPSSFDVQYYNGTTWVTHWSEVWANPALPHLAGTTKAFKFARNKGRRKWRIDFTAKGSAGAWFSIYEVEVRETLGGPNLAPIAYPSSNRRPETAYQLFDSDYATQWQSGSTATPLTVGLYFDKDVESIAEITIKGGLATGDSPTAGNVQYYDEVSGNWVTSWSFEAGGWTSAETKILKSPEVELPAYQTTFARASLQTDFNPLGITHLDESFTSDEEQLVVTSETTQGAVTFTGGTLTLDHTGVQNTIVRAGDDIELPICWVELDVISRTSFGSGYNNVGVGIAKDANNFIYASFDQSANVRRVQVKIAGSNAFYGSGSYTFPSSCRIALSLVLNSATVWVNTGTGWNALTSFQIATSVVNMATLDLTGWKPSFTMAASASSTWVFDNLKAGLFGGTGIRDITLITNDNGTPVDFAGNYRFTATSSGPSGLNSSFNSVWEYNPTNYSITMTGALMTSRDGLRCLDLNAHVVKNSDGSYRVITASWGNGFGGILQCFHKNDVGDITSGLHLITGMDQLSLPLIPGTGAGGAYDPYLIKEGTNWLLAYAVVSDTSFSGENFYIAAATSPDMVTFTGVGADSSRAQVEGPKIVKHNGKTYIYGGGRGRQPVYDATMAYVGQPTFSPSLYNGIDTQPHVMIVPHDNDYHCLTWNQTRFGSATFTWGDFLVYVTERYPDYKVQLLLKGDQQADAATTILDSSARMRSPSLGGDVQIDTAQAKIGTGSILFDGTGDYLSYSSDSGLQLVNDSFTIECWARFAANKGTHTIWSKRPTSNASEGWGYVNNLNQINMQLFRDTGSVGETALLVSASYEFLTNTWYHLAWSYDVNTGTGKVIVNGVVVASGVRTVVPVVNTSSFYIGREPTNTARDMNGWIDNFRMTKGLAKY